MKTVIEMAREAGFTGCLLPEEADNLIGGVFIDDENWIKPLERFAALVREDERELPTMQDAIEAGNGVLLNEQAALLRELRLALDDLLNKKPELAGLLCGTTTLGNHRATLYDYRPSGVFGGTK